MEKLAIITGAFNIIVEFILLMAVDRISGFATPMWKKAMCACVIGLYASLCMLPWGAATSGSYLRWCLLTVIGLALYWRSSKCVPKIMLFLLLNFGVEGFQNLAQEKQLLSFSLAGLVIAFICVFCFRDGGSQRYIAVELNHNDRSLHLTALVDSGNTLRDPITGEPVLIISHKAAQELTGLTKAQLCSPLDTLESIPFMGLRLIPYHSIGMDNGMLLAMFLPGCKLAGKEKDLLVAFAPAGLGKEGSFQALAGGDL